MPVIIDEVIISVQVEAGGQAPGAGQSAASGDERRALVNECVERVLEILVRKEER